MSLAFVSSMNTQLYHYYGKRFLEEFSKFASNDIRLFIIFEGDYPEEILHIGENIITVPLTSEKHNRFMKKFSKLEEAKGLRIKIFNENGVKKINFRQDYRFNAIRFSYKPFSIDQSLNYLPKNLEYLIWTDADLRCRKKFYSKDMLEFLPQNEELMSFLGRRNAYSECGFLGFNLRHPSIKEYLTRITDIYESGEIFSLPQWHDSFIWDHVRKEFEEKNKVNFRNISGNAYDKEHVFYHTKLNDFFDHLKGDERKKAGDSSMIDNSKIVDEFINKN